MRVRVRGIYATALTRVFLDVGADVVQASEPIRARFDADLGDGDHDVAVETSADRQGVRVEGDPAAVEGDPAAVEEATDCLSALGVDLFAWPSPAPTGAVFDARVVDTVGAGAVCDLGETEGYLPFANTDDHVSVDDTLRVQVSTSSPPWSDDRPVLDTDLRAVGGLATLVPGRDDVTVDTYDDAAGRELAGMTALLGADPPSGWGVRWTHAATGADMDTLNAALERAAERAEELDPVLDEPVGDPGRLVTQGATTWVWFGHETRTALDARRREVTPTMPGHHRTKASSESASAGVDFAEALCTPDGEGEFPFEAVTRQFGPTKGDTIRIAHGKPDGRLIVLGSGEVVEWDPEGVVSVERRLRGGGTYDALEVPRADGDTALTKFREGRWWYPTVYRDSEGEHKGTYVNVCTPVECFPDEVRYVDLHVDVVKHPDGTVERVDDDELDESVEAGHVSEELAEKARQVAGSIERAL